MSYIPQFNGCVYKEGEETILCIERKYCHHNQIYTKTLKFILVIYQ